MDFKNISSVQARSALPGTSALMDPSQMKNLPKAQQISQAAKQFEAILIRQMIGDSVGKLMSGGDKTSSGAGGDVYGYMLTDSLAANISANGGLGMGKIFEQQLTPKAGVQKGTSL